MEEKNKYNQYNKNLSFFDKIKGFLGSPSETFRKVKNEDFMESFKYYMILVVALYAILSIVFSIVLSYVFYYVFTSNSYIYYSSFLSSASIANINSSNFISAFLIFSIIMGYVIAVITALISYFIGGLWIHLWVYILGGRKGIPQTLKAYGYGQTPTLIFGWIPFIGGIFSIWSLIVYIIGIRELHEISTGKAVAAVLLAIFIPVIIISSIIFVYVSTILF
jgi:hypothetical protein